MIFDTYVKEAEGDDVDAITASADPNTEDGLEAIAKEVEANMMTAAMESMTWFEDGEEVQKAYVESAGVQSLIEAGKMSKKTYMILSKNDDLTRRAHLASLVLARNAKDPLFNQLALNRVKERKLRSTIFNKYKTKAMVVAKRSQKVHIKNTKATKAPVIKFN
jgi:hypothetical protein